jgi:hypothetical protein
MKLHEMVALTLACAAPLLLAACGGGDSESVTGAGSTYPSVSGTWEGRWTQVGGGPGADVTLELGQSRDQVQGRLTVGRVVNEVTGTVSELGVLHFRGQEADGCITYSTESPHLVLRGGNATLDGPVVRSEPNLGGPCTVAIHLLTEGRMELRKVR